jgi:hypothetical protein
MDSPSSFDIGSEVPSKGWTQTPRAAASITSGLGGASAAVLNGLGNGPQAATDKAINANTKILKAGLNRFPINPYIIAQEIMSPRIRTAARIKIWGMTQPSLNKIDAKPRP